MAFDPAIHEIHPETGFMVHKNTGHLVGIEQVPVVSEPAEYPKWVEVHGSHLNGGIAQDFAETSRDRGGVARVLVYDADEEAKALAEKPVDKPVEEPVVVEPEAAEAHETHAEKAEPVPGFPAPEAPRFVPFDEKPPSGTHEQF